MTSVNVLVVFYSRYGETEKLALAAGVGGIQARGNIRVRRLPDLVPAERIEADLLWRENLERMKKDYIGPREIDGQWADVLILAAPPDCLAEMERYLDSAQPALSGKLGAVVGPCAKAAARVGITVVPPSEADLVDPTGYGRRVTETARSKKASRSNAG